MPCGLHVSRSVSNGPPRGSIDLASGGAGSADEPQKARRPERARGWLQPTLAAIWIAVLLLVVAYIAVKGEAAISELDALDLSAYSSSPP